MTDNIDSNSPQSEFHDSGSRLRLPRQGEVLGTVNAMLGGGRLSVSCKDGHERVCRIPGKIRRQIWVREGDVVIIKPWEIESDKKGDIIWRYSRIQAQTLKDKGHVRS